MQTLRFDSSITGLSSFQEKLAVLTEKDGLFIVKSDKSIIENQYPIASHLSVSGAPLWTKSGEHIFVPCDKVALYIKPNQNASFYEVIVDSPITRFYQHSDSDAVIALLDNGAIVGIKPLESQDLKYYVPKEKKDTIVSVTYQENNIMVVIDSDEPRIDIIDPITFEFVSSVDIQPRDTSLFNAITSEFGTILIWSDGFWCKYVHGEAITSYGKMVAARSFSIIGSHICTANESSISIFDLKFDSLLEEINISSTNVCLFNNRIASSSSSKLDIRPWHGVSKTTTRDLIGTSKDQKPEYKELNIELAYNEEIEQPTTSKVDMKEAHFHVKSLKHLVNSVLDDKFVSSSAREKANKLIEKEEESDVRELAMFHIGAVINYDTVLKSLEEGSFDTVSMMLKKIEPLTSEQLLNLIRKSLSILEQNEIILAHLIMQPHSEHVVIDAIKSLQSNEVNELLLFMAKIIQSRRKWRDFEASLTAMDSTMRWTSIVCKNHRTVLTIQGLTQGLVAIKAELDKEKDLISAASQCWSILECISEGKQASSPPAFMYIVDTLPIPE